MTTAGDPPFTDVAIVGVGLIGGSIALALRECWPSVRIVGVDRPAVLAHAMGSGAIDHGVSSVGELGTPDLVILAAPVRQNVRVLGELLPQTLQSAVVTDVGGTKRDILKAARVLPVSARFVGGHPIGGAERGGFGFARPDLFRGRPWILTPTTGDATPDLDRLTRFAAGLGARPRTMDAAEHDRIMAFVSHLPQLTASALMATAGRAVGEEGLAVAGRGLVDTTRLASSPASVWRDICLTNADAIRDALDQLIDRLSDLRADLQRGDAFEAEFGDAARWRGELMKDRD